MLAWLGKTLNHHSVIIIPTYLIKSDGLARGRVIQGVEAREFQTGRDKLRNQLNCCLWLVEITPGDVDTGNGGFVQILWAIRKVI